MRRSRVQASTIENEQERECPLCGELKTLRGLHGHLRLKHHKQGAEIMELIEQAPAAQSGAGEEVLNLLELMRHLKERDCWIDVLEARGCFEHEETVVQLRETIRIETRPIFDRLADHSVILDDSDISAYCFIGSANTGA